MNAAMPTRYSKFTPPVSGASMPRPELLGRLQEARGCPLIWLAAPPGSGKTTRLASMPAQTSAPTTWYRFDGDDATVPAFVASLADAESGGPDRHRANPECTRTSLRQAVRVALCDLSAGTMVVIDDLDASMPSAMETVLPIIADEVRSGPRSLHHCLALRSARASGGNSHGSRTRNRGTSPPQGHSRRTATAVLATAFRRVESICALAVLPWPLPPILSITGEIPDGGCKGRKDAAGLPVTTNRTRDPAMPTHVASQSSSAGRIGQLVTIRSRAARVRHRVSPPRFVLLCEPDSRRPWIAAFFRSRTRQRSLSLSCTPPRSNRTPSGITKQPTRATARPRLSTLDRSHQVLQRRVRHSPVAAAPTPYLPIPRPSPPSRMPSFAGSRAPFKRPAARHRRKGKAFVERSTSGASLRHGARTPGLQIFCVGGLRRQSCFWDATHRCGGAMDSARRCSPGATDWRSRRTDDWRPRMCPVPNVFMRHAWLCLALRHPTRRWTLPLRCRGVGPIVPMWCA